MKKPTKPQAGNVDEPQTRVIKDDLFTYDNRDIPAEEQIEMGTRPESG